VDVRVITATQRPMNELVCTQDFREDLRARLEGHSVHLTPLAQRREDLGILIASILGRICECPPPLHPNVGRLFWQYDWPLNIRELEMVLRHAIAFAPKGPIQQHHLPAGLSKHDVGLVALTHKAAVLGGTGAAHTSGALAAHAPRQYK
jgi:DNA-binding NtrC family response regulator